MCALFPSSQRDERVQHARTLSHGFYARLHLCTVCGLIRRFDTVLSSPYQPTCVSCRCMHFASSQTSLPLSCLTVWLEEMVMKQRSQDYTCIRRRLLPFYCEGSRTCGCQSPSSMRKGRQNNPRKNFDQHDAPRDSYPLFRLSFSVFQMNHRQVEKRNCLKCLSFP